MLLWESLFFGGEKLGEDLLVKLVVVKVTRLVLQNRSLAIDLKWELYNPSQSKVHSGRVFSG